MDTSSSKVRWQPESPFVETYVTEPEAPSPFLVHGESPFLNQYEVDDESPGDPTSELLGEVLAELEDDEFDDAVYELVDEASDVAASYPAGEIDDGRTERVERLLYEHLAPLASAAEAMVDAADEATSALDLATATEGEIHEAVERAAGDPSLASPAFEHFFGALKKKLKKTLSKAAGFVKKGLKVVAGPLIKALLGKLKALVRPILQRVLTIALDKVPERYRPLAAQVARRLGIKVPEALPAASHEPVASAGEPADTSPQPGDTAEPTEPATPAADDVQRELDLEIAELLLASASGRHREADPLDREVPLEPEPAHARDPLTDLDRARTRFVREVLEAGDDVDRSRAAVENFLPAVAFALRSGIKLIGKPKVVSFLGGLIAKFIAPMVGQANAPALGRLLADTGLSLALQGEARDDGSHDPASAGEAVAAAVEETLRRVAGLPDDVLDQPQLLETFAHEAFEAAAAANFPASLIRPELRETEASGVWVQMPRRGRKLYKKFSNVLSVTITPPVAARVESYDGTPLSTFFRERLRLPPGATVTARVHVYEAVPRTRLARIARGEGVRGLGSARPAAWSQFHPLTPDAAGLLLGSPRLGRRFAPDAERRQANIGERYYFLEIHEAPVQPLGRESHIHLTADFVKNEVRVCAYLSEVAAQKIAGSLRKRAPTNVILTELRSVLAGQIQKLSTHAPAKRVRIRLAFGARGSGARTAARAPGAERGISATLGVDGRRALRRRLASQVLGWSWARLGEFFEQRAAEFIAACDGPEDGVRVAITFRAPPGFDALRAAFRGRAIAAGEWPPRKAPGATIAVKAGPKHD